MERNESGHGRDDRCRPVVLLVEDEFLIRMASADWLRDEGFEVIEAANGAEALAVLASDHELALVATDVNLGDGPTGLDVAAQAARLRPGVPVLLVSAHVPPDETSNIGAFVQKPYGPTELVRWASKLIGDTWRTRKDDRRAC